MRKKVLPIFLLVASLFIFNKANAQVLIPKYLDVSSSSQHQNQTLSMILNSGDNVDVRVMLEGTNLPEDKTLIEYGVVRQIKDGNITNYEPVGLANIVPAYLQDGETSSPVAKTIKIAVPNTLESNGTSTYVFYAKSYVTDDSDKENFILSKQSFKIKGNSSPITKIKYINLLQSNGQRYSLSHGPTIYNLLTTKYKGVASSTAIEVTFESNVDTKISPNITFKKLRSDVTLASFRPDEILIKKGLNTVIISLPTFNYEAGVYQGVMELGNASMPNVDFQYIVAGDMVTFKQPQYLKTPTSQVLNFGINGTPFDFDLDFKLNNISTSSVASQISSPSIYHTEFILKNKKNKEIYKISDAVNFSTSTYALIIPLNIKDIAKVSIKSVNSEGIVVYEGTKELNLSQSSFINFNLILLAILFLAVILLIIIFKDIKARLVLLLIAVIIIFLGYKVSTADVWGVPDSLVTYQNFSGDAQYYKDLTMNHSGALIRFNTNIQTEAYDINDDLEFVYNTSFEACNNNPTYLDTQLSLYSDGKLLNIGGQGSIGSAYGNYGGYGYTSYASYQKHNNTYTSPWYSVNMGKVTPSDSIAIVANHSIHGYFSSSKNANVTYTIPLFNVTDKINTRKCTDGKITNMVSIGNAPYVVRIMSVTPTDEPCGSIPSIDVRVDSVTTSQGNVIWNYTDPKPQTAYQVDISRDLGFSSVIKSITSTNGDTNVSNIRDALMDGLNSDTIYYVRVKANNGDTWSDWANTSFSTTKENNCPTGSNCDVKTVSGCGVSVVGDGVGLTSATANLCLSDFTSSNFGINSYTQGFNTDVWHWECRSTTDASQGVCSAKCGAGLTYCATTKTCSSKGCDGDMCPSINGKQTADDQIYKNGCVKPALKMSLKFTGNPYADENTSRCSVDWTPTTNISDLSKTTCILDGTSVENKVSGYKTIVGQHNLTCITKVEGLPETEGATPIVLSSDPSVVNFKCARVPKSTEN